MRHCSRYADRREKRYTHAMLCDRDDAIIAVSRIAFRLLYSATRTLCLPVGAAWLGTRRLRIAGPASRLSSRAAPSSSSPRAPAAEEMRNSANSKLFSNRWIRRSRDEKLQMNTRKARSTPATKSKQQATKLPAVSKMLLRHCCWCGRSLNDANTHKTAKTSAGTVFVL